MAQTNLKRSARNFMAAHQGVPYLTALKAVDEPLHELRELSRMPDRELTAIHSHFRLVGGKSIYDPAFPLLRSLNRESSEGEGHRELIEAKGLSRFESTSAFLRETGRRVMLLEDAGAEDIWAYRALQRGGALGKYSEPIEPFLHHFGAKLPWGFETIVPEGPRLGIFAVSVASFLELEERVSLIPVTETQLTALCSGSPLGELRLPPVYLPAAGGPKWEERGDLRFSKICYSHREVAGKPRLTLLFREDPLASGFSIEDLGLSWDDFTVEDAGKHWWYLALSRDELVLSTAGNRQYEGCSDGVLEIHREHSNQGVTPPSAASLLSPPTSLSSRIRNLDHAIRLIGKISTLDRVTQNSLRPVVTRSLEYHGGVATMAQIVGALWGSSDRICSALGAELYAELYTNDSADSESILEIVLNLREYSSANAVYRDSVARLVQVILTMLERADRSKLPGFDWNLSGVHRLASALTERNFQNLILAVETEGFPTDDLRFYLEAREEGMSRSSLITLRIQMKELNLIERLSAEPA